MEQPEALWLADLLCADPSLKHAAAAHKLRELHVENEKLRSALNKAVCALELPCDRWNKTQSLIVRDAINQSRAALKEQQ